MMTRLNEIQRFFEKTIGLNPSLVSQKAWEDLITRRLEHSSTPTIEAYLRLIHHSDQELQKCINELTVPETWFFRDKASIDFTVECAGMWLKKYNQEKFRVLTIPCSTGEEPYSLAIAFDQKSFPEKYLTIDAFDINKSSIAKAIAGEYALNSFRGNDLEYRDKYFTSVGGGAHYLLQERVRTRVHFSYGNILDEQLAFQQKKYDVVFCRNLFIYFHPAAQKAALNVIKELLKPNGYLVVSVAETEIVKREGFVMCNPARAGAFQIQSSKIEKTKTQKLQMDQIAYPLNKKIKSSIIEQPLRTINDAYRLADQGRLDEALEICHDISKSYDTDPSLFFLIGLISHSQHKDEDAEENFLKTVYLDSDHYEALAYLALMAEKRGDPSQAELFRDRAKRSHKV